MAKKQTNVTTFKPKDKVKRKKHAKTDSDTIGSKNYKKPYKGQGR